jgi:hypothetical protein
MQNIQRKEARGNGDLTRESKRKIAVTTPSFYDSHRRQTQETNRVDAEKEKK